MKIISWNLALLPKFLNIYRDPNRVFDIIIERILVEDADIISLQELADVTAQKKLIDALKSNNYSTYYSKNNWCLNENGLLIATKEEIINVKNHKYESLFGLEYLFNLFGWGNKGIIMVETENHVIYNTHLQSDYCCLNRLQKQTRINQHNELKKFIEEPNKTTILCGDLNDDYEDSSLQQLIRELPFTCCNDEKIVTFPSKNKQLDYILINNKTAKYSYKDASVGYVSDHQMLIAKY
jgi:endonuclease/exonuclease/phosphatase family metal-dependent hydrolase